MKNWTRKWLVISCSFPSFYEVNFDEAFDNLLAYLFPFDESHSLKLGNFWAHKWPVKFSAVEMDFSEAEKYEWIQKSSIFHTIFSNL